MSENHEVRWKRLFFGMLAVLLLAILASSSAQAGFVRQDGKRYYYRTSGRKVKGWLKKGKRTYYLDPDQDGAVTVGYLKLICDGPAWQYLLCDKERCTVPGASENREAVLLF